MTQSSFQDDVPASPGPSRPLGQSHPGVALEEYRQLRATIRSRGSLRVALALATMSIWALLAGLQMAFVLMPIAALPPLVVLMVGFEAVYALHVGAERIGRYLLARHETGVAPPLWEGAIAAFGAGHRPSARPADALFTSYFVMAVGLNGLVGSLGATRPEWIALALAHGAALVRIVMARRTVGRQRDEDLARFRDVLAK